MDCGVAEGVDVAGAVMAVAGAVGIDVGAQVGEIIGGDVGVGSATA